MSKLQVNEIVDKEGTGSPTFTNGVVVSGVGTFSSQVSIAGTLTYEDVTNIDAVGVVTARTGVKVLAGGINAVGVVTATSFSGNGSALTGIAATDNIDTNTIRVSGVSTFTEVVNASSDVRVTGNLNAGITTTSSLINGTALSHRNILINGNMLIAQRSTSAVNNTLSGPNYATLDRWLTWAGTASRFSVQQVADAPSGFKYSLKVLSLGANADEGYQAIGQRIESANITQLSLGTAYAQPFTLSFWVRSSLTGTFTGYIHGVSSFQPSYVYTYTISVADTWEKKVINVPAATIGSGKFGSGGAEAGLEIGFTLSGNSYKTANANTWVNETYKLEVTGLTSVDITGTNAATFYVTGVQLEAGSVATPFEHRSFGEELIRCQRYFQSYPHDDNSTAEGLRLNGDYSSVYQTPMRAVPTGFVFGTGGTAGSNSGKYDKDAVGNQNAAIETKHSGFEIDTDGGVGLAAVTLSAEI